MRSHLLRMVSAKKMRVVSPGAHNQLLGRIPSRCAPTLLEGSLCWGDNPRAIDSPQDMRFRKPGQSDRRVNCPGKPHAALSYPAVRCKAQARPQKGAWELTKRERKQEGSQTAGSRRKAKLQDEEETKEKAGSEPQGVKDGRSVSTIVKGIAEKGIVSSPFQSPRSGGAAKGRSGTWVPLATPGNLVQLAEQRAARGPEGTHSAGRQGRGGQEKTDRDHFVSHLSPGCAAPPPPLYDMACQQVYM